MINTILWDVDGTLLDSTDVWHAIDVEFLEKRGLSMTQDYGEAVSVMHLQQAAVYTIERFSLNETVSFTAFSLF